VYYLYRAVYLLAIIFIAKYYFIQHFHLPVTVLLYPVWILGCPVMVWWLQYIKYISFFDSVNNGTHWICLVTLLLRDTTPTDVITRCGFVSLLVHVNHDMLIIKIWIRVCINHATYLVYAVITQRCYKYPLRATRSILFWYLSLYI
jgi:hypothetical protein